VLGRTLRWIGTQIAFLVVLTVLAVAFCYLLVVPGRWGRAAGIVAVAVLLAGLLRAVAPTAWVGFLAVRARWVDTVLYLALGGLILAVDIRLHA
jgi:Protein of unknown function (DUF3017)